MGHDTSEHCSPADEMPMLPAIGTVIDICGGEEGLFKFFRRMLKERLLWTEKAYSPLGVPQRLLPSPLFSDAYGLQIMRQISRLPSFYMTNGEVEQFEEAGREIAGVIPQNAMLIDLGCGDTRKVKPLLDYLETLKNEVWYFALDLSKEDLERGMESLKPHYQYVKCYGLWGNFEDGLAWLNSQPFDRPRFFMSLGSIFGNDHFHDAVALLSRWTAQAFRGKADAMLLTMDATSDEKTVWDNYNDSEGLFEHFIRNGYMYSNRVLGHEWYRDEDWEFFGVIQTEPLMHRFVLRAKKDVICDQLNLHFPMDMEIDCYEAFKYPPEFMRREFAESGLYELACWKAPRTQIYQYLLAPGNSQECVTGKLASLRKLS